MPSEVPIEATLAGESTSIPVEDEAREALEAARREGR